MKFSKLSEYFSRIEATTSRNEMTAILAELFKESSKDEIDEICYLSLGRLAPLYEGIEFNLAEKMMVRVLSAAFGVDQGDVGKLYKERGDLGEVAEHLSRMQANKRRIKANLAVGEVYDRLYEVAMEAGAGSVERKISKTAKLLDDLDARSAKYVVRIPIGKLRLGFSDLTILDALSWMIVGDKSKRVEIEEAFNVQADIGQIARIIKKEGLKGLKGIKVSLGVPIMPALCQRLPTAEEMVKKMCKPSEALPSRQAGLAKEGKVAAEPKYDGTRLQVHFSRKRKWEQKEDQLPFAFKPPGFVQSSLRSNSQFHPPVGFVRTFTRNLENTTHMFPDLIQAVFEEVDAQEAILDCEAIGFDPKTGRFLPFQETIKRKRKYEIGKKAKEIPLKFFCFDVLYISTRQKRGEKRVRAKRGLYKNGKDLLKTPFSKRREILEKILSPENKTIVPSPQIVTDSPQELKKYHVKQIKKGLEGVVVKKWEAPYDPGRRGYTWVKFKQEKGKKGGGLADTLDCVVMGYYRGRGKRAEFGIGAFLAGVSRAGEEFLTISKVGTGLSDEQWRELKVKSDKFKVKSKPKEYLVDKNLAPDVWLSPGLVVEIEADNITKSPIHTAQYALRFPRLVRFRDDKSPEQTTTVKEVETLFKQQKSHK